jgi:nucleotide-binding universal stress UspA family protein
VGQEAEGIVAFAVAGSVDLIVLGSRGRTGVTRTLLGSVASDVLASTQASVLVVRART